MALTFPLTPPAAFRPSEVLWAPQAAAGISRGEFDWMARKFEWDGKQLEALVSLPAMVRADGDAVAAFLTALKGPLESFLFGPVGPGATAKGVASGAPLVNGADQSGAQIITDGWTASQTGILKAWDFLQVGSGALARLHTVLEDENSDGGGNATLDLFPSLYESPADNSAVVVSSPKGVFRLKDFPRWRISAGYLYHFEALVVEQDI